MGTARCQCLGLRVVTGTPLSPLPLPPSFFFARAWFLAPWTHLSAVCVRPTTWAQFLRSLGGAWRCHLPGHAQCRKGARGQQRSADSAVGCSRAQRETDCLYHV